MLSRTYLSERSACMPRFLTPAGDVEFEIPDEWWRFCDMETFRRTTQFYPYYRHQDGVITVPIGEVQPPIRDAGITGLHKNRVAPILLAFTSDRCAVPAVAVQPLDAPSNYRYAVADGYHRFYASIAAGYELLPVIVR